MDERDVAVAAEEPHYLLALARPQQTRVDKDAGQPVADRLVEKHRRDRIDPAGEPQTTPLSPTCRRIRSIA
jgi:hypothetical protein